MFQAAKIVYLIGFCVLLFALIAASGREAHKAGRLGAIGVSTAIIGTMFLAGDLWFESFAVPWLAAGPASQVLTSEPSTLFALGAISSYLLFALGWVLFGIASLRARVFPIAISLAIVVGGLAGYSARHSPRPGPHSTRRLDAEPDTTAGSPFRRTMSHDPTGHATGPMEEIFPQRDARHLASPGL